LVGHHWLRDPLFLWFPWWFLQVLPTSVGLWSCRNRILRWFRPFLLHSGLGLGA
jgi:hypothetical protein